MRYAKRFCSGAWRWGSAGWSGLLVAVWVCTVYAAPPERPPVPVVVGHVVQQPTAATIDVVGTVEPSIATRLSTEIAGLTVRFDPREGDVVQQDKTVVAQLKATEFELSLVEAEAELARAREVLKKLKAGLRKEELDEKRAELQERKTWVDKYAKDLERMKAMQSKDIASASQYDLAESTYVAAKAQHERAQHTLRVAELGARQEDIAAAEAEIQRLQARAQRLRDDIRKTTIRSPVSGVITQRYTEVGQWLELGGTIADLMVLDPVLVRVPVHEKDISRLHVGDEATVILDALPEHPFTGHIKHIIPQADLASRTFPVKIEVPNTPEITLKSGMFARVTLRPGSAQPTLFVPKDAVVRRPTGQVVFVVYDSKVRLVPIKTGRAHAGALEIVEGNLHAGDLVVITGNETLEDQAAVVVKETARN